MILVADASALVALAACDRLVLLDEIFGRVIVPEAVYREVAQPDKFQSNRLKEYLQGKVRQVDMQGIVYPRWRPSAEACRFRCPRPSLDSRVADAGLSRDRASSGAHGKAARPRAGARRCRSCGSPCRCLKSGASSATG
jgi:hypothetical protein